MFMQISGVVNFNLLSRAMRKLESDPNIPRYVDYPQENVIMRDQTSFNSHAALLDNDSLSPASTSMEKTRDFNNNNRSLL